MRHEELRDELYESRDGELPVSRREALARHVEDCAACRAELRDWERLSRAFLGRPAAPAPAPAETERFVRSVMSRLPASASARFSLREFLSGGAWLTPALGLASAALLLSFVPYGGRSAAASAPVPLFVADGQAITLAASPLVRPESVGEAVGLDDEAR